MQVCVSAVQRRGIAALNRLISGPDSNLARRSRVKRPADLLLFLGSLICLLGISTHFANAQKSTATLTVGTPTVDTNGVKYYPVTSIYQGSQPQTIRVLQPTNPAAGQAPKILFVLPVDTGVDTTTSTYSDGLEELRLLDVQDRFNMTLIAPSFNYSPWYGDNPGDATRRMESFVIDDLVPFGNSFAQGTVPQRYLIGFSKSGNAVLFLILRHPGIFNGAAAWDSPAQVSDINISDFTPDLPINFGTQTNFALYNIPSLVSSNAGPFLQQNRIWISGDHAVYTAEMDELNTQMTAAGVLHTWVAGGIRTHSWDSGWLDGAVIDLDLNAKLTAPFAGTLPPPRTGGLPFGTLPAGTTQTTLTVDTDQRASCRYATSSGTAYDSMSKSFSTTGGTEHTTLITGLQDGNSYSYYVRCEDSATGAINNDDYAISFSVAVAPGEPGDTATSSFSGTESPLSENGLWSSAGSWTGLQKDNGAYSTNNSSASRLVTPVTDSNQFAEITFDQDPGTDSWVGVTTRVQGMANGSNYLAIANSGQVILFRTDDSAKLNWTLLASANVDLSASPRLLRLESVGPTHRVYFNGVLELTYTDPANVYATGQPGIAASVYGGPTVKILTFSGGAFSNLAATPSFNVPGGTYTSTQTVTISDATAGSTIYYTTDGTTPTASSMVYSGPIEVSSTMTLEAIAMASGYSTSAVASATYTIQPPPTFTLTASPGALTMSAGSQGEVTLSVTPQNGFNSKISFSCSGLPSGANCSFSPPTVTPSGSVATTTLTISTTSQAAVVQTDHTGVIPEMALAGLLCLFGWRRRRGLVLLAVMAVVGTGLILGCSGGSGSGGGSTTQPVYATVNVTATSGTLQKAATLSLTIK